MSGEIQRIQAEWVTIPHKTPAAEVALAEQMRLQFNQALHVAFFDYNYAEMAARLEAPNFLKEFRARFLRLVPKDTLLRVGIAFIGDLDKKTLTVRGYFISRPEPAATVN